MFSTHDRDRVVARLTDAAKADERVPAAALVGSLWRQEVDRWADIDLAFGVADAAHVRPPSHRLHRISSATRSITPSARGSASNEDASGRPNTGSAGSGTTRWPWRADRAIFPRGDVESRLHELIGDWSA